VSTPANSAYTGVPLRIASAALWLVILTACGQGNEYSGDLPSPDGERFVRDVYPVLLRDCAFHACHGGADRFFQVFGPGRVRLDPKLTKPDDAMTLAEVLRSYDRARSMLATADDRQHATLLSKPLEPAAGGQGHKGVDELGRNVFATTTDPEYALLATWARSTGLPPTAAQVDAANAAAELARDVAP
jgi:hypothetical protein